MILCYPKTRIDFRIFLNSYEVETINQRKLWIMVVALLLVLAGGYGYHRYHYFNQNIYINGVKVGGMNATQALKKLKTASTSQKVYLANDLIYQHDKTNSGFSSKDMPKIKQLVKRQWTILPSSRQQNFVVEPSAVAKNSSTEQSLKKIIEKKNQQRPAARDAYALLKAGQVTIVKQKAGKKYDFKALLKQYRQQQFLPKVELETVYQQPLKAKSKIVQLEKKKLEVLKQRTVVYQVENTKYNLAAKDYIEKAVYQNGKYQILANKLPEKIGQINQQQSTLQKGISFRTHDGSTVQIASGGTYGWALKSSQAVAHLEKAFISGKKLIDAQADIYGVGYLTYGTGYDLGNSGIGNSYAEVSIEQQHLWIYKDGKEIVSTNVVTGKHSTGEDTPKGLWYIMYKQSPSTLQGSEVGNANYSVKVKYWAQFTNSGCGFHDASWRTNWASDAYLNNGSGGCVNTPSNVMANVYNNLSQKEAVVVY